MNRTCTVENTQIALAREIHAALMRHDIEQSTARGNVAFQWIGGEIDDAQAVAALRKIDARELREQFAGKGKGTSHGR